MTEKKNIYQRMLAVKAECPTLVKDTHNAHMKFDYVSHDQVMAVLHEPCVKHGVHISVTEVTSGETKTLKGNARLTVELAVCFRNADNPDDHFIVTFTGASDSGSDKAYGQAYSYAFKNCLLKSFQLASGDKDDTDAHGETKQQTKSKPAAPKKITKKQVKALELLMVTFGGEMAEIEASVCDTYKVGSLSNLTVPQFEEAIRRLKLGLAKRNIDVIESNEYQALIRAAKKKKLKLAAVLEEVGCPGGIPTREQFDKAVKIIDTTEVKK